MKKQLILLSVWLAFGLYGFQPAVNYTVSRAPEHGVTWMKSYQKAQEKARKKDKLIFLLFTGSDWCPPCKNLHKYLFSDAEFIKLANKHFVLYAADFPRRKDMYDAETMQTNRNLKAKYGIRGFPTVVIVTPAGKEIARRTGFGFDHNTEYHIAMMKKAVAEYNE